MKPAGPWDWGRQRGEWLCVCVGGGGGRSAGSPALDVTVTGRATGTGSRLYWYDHVGAPGRPEQQRAPAGEFDSGMPGSACLCQLPHQGSESSLPALHSY
jgi:hypothetical protein